MILKRCFTCSNAAHCPKRIERCILNRFFAMLTILLVYATTLSCHKNNAPGDGAVGIVFFGEFPDPKSIFENIRKDLKRIQGVDSIRVYGLPLTESVVVVEPDSARCRRYGLTTSEFDKQMAEFGGDLPPTELGQMVLTVHKGQVVPLAAVAQIKMQAVPFRPDVYLPEHYIFHYKDEKAVLIKAYFNAEFLQNARKNVLQVMLVQTENLAAFSGWRWELADGNVFAD
jgi:hypothetical protein